MPAYTDPQGRPWDLTAVPAHNTYAGGHVVGYLCWVKSTIPVATHPGDFARTAHGLAGHVIVAPTVAHAIAAGQQYADNHP